MKVSEYVRQRHIKYVFNEWVMCKIMLLLFLHVTYSVTNMNILLFDAVVPPYIAHTGEAEKKCNITEFIQNIKNKIKA